MSACDYYAFLIYPLAGESRITKMRNEQQLVAEVLAKIVLMPISIFSELSGATMILKQFSLHQCGHDEAPRPAAKCLKSMLGEKNPQR